MEGWEDRALGELFRVGSSKRVLKSQWRSSGVPFYRGREVTSLAADGFVNNELFISESDYEKYAAKYGVPAPGDIVMTAIGTIGNSYIVREGDRFYFKDASVLWLKKEGTISSEFVNAWFKSSQFFDQLEKGNGATVDTLTIRKLQCVRVPLPPLAEQERIVAILDEAFAGIATATAHAEKNLANARELFESHLNAVFTQKGEGWVEKKLGDLLETQPRNGWSPPARNHSDVGIPVLTLSSVTGFNFGPSKIKYTSASTKPDAHYWVSNGDLLITRSNTHELVGHVAICDGIESPTIYPDLIMKMKVDEHAAKTRFVYYQLRSSKLRAYISGSANGANPTMKKISKQVVQNIPLVVPNTTIQELVVSKLDVIQSHAQHLESIYQCKLAALAELKQSILQKAFTRELTAEPDRALQEAGL